MNASNTTIAFTIVGTWVGGCPSADVIDIPLCRKFGARFPRQLLTVMNGFPPLAIEAAGAPTKPGKRGSW